MRSSHCSEYYRCRRTEPIGLARLRLGLVVSNIPSRLSGRHRPPLPCVHGFILSSASLPLQSLVPSRIRRLAAATRLPSRRFLPPSRHQFTESTFRRASHVSPSFRPQRFSRSRRVAPPCTWWACFIPHAAFEVRPSGAFPDTQPNQLVAGSFSLDLLTASLLQLGEPNCSGARSRAFRALIQVPIRLHRQMFYVCQRLDPLLSCQIPRVFTQHLGGAFAPPPLMTLAADSSSDASSWSSASQQCSS